MLTPLLVSSLVLLLLGTVLPFISRSKNSRRAALIMTALSALLLSIFAVGILFSNQEFGFLAYRFIPPLEISLFADRLSAAFVLLISAVSFGTAIYSMEYAEDENHSSRSSLLVALMNLFILSMLLVVISGNGFSFLLFWELMSLASLMLVLYEYESQETRKAGLFYFIMTSLCTVFLFIAFISLYNLTGSFDLKNFAKIAPASLSVIFPFVFLGFGIKAGIVPFHKWLPYAHPASPSNISALMSGAMLKVAIYGLLRFLVTVEPELWWGILILIFGSLSAVLGVVYALKEHDIKRMLAYSSIENVGIIFTGIGLYVIFRESGLSFLAELSLASAVFHSFNHALFKSLLFLAAGSIVHETGTRNIEEMGGLIKRMPHTAFLFLIGLVSIAGLPPTNGFVSELMLYQAYFYSSALVDPLLKVLLIITLSGFALTSALAAALFVKLFGITFLALPRAKCAEEAHEVPKLMLFGEAVPAALCILAGLFSSRAFNLLGFNLEVPDMLLLGLILIGTSGLVWFAVRNYGFSGSPRISKETWGCGILAQQPTMEYTSAGFSEPLVVIFKKVYRTQISSTRKYADSKESIFESGAAEIQLIKFFEEYLYFPAARAVSRASYEVSKMQNGKLDTYVLYVFLAVLTLMVFTRCFA